MVAESSMTANATATFAGASSFVAESTMTALGYRIQHSSASTSMASQMTSTLRHFWEDEADITETWSTVAKPTETWTTITKPTETWTDNSPFQEAA